MRKDRLNILIGRESIPSSNYKHGSGSISTEKNYENLSLMTEKVHLNTYMYMKRLT
jgi:hypothetical protein